MWLKDTLFYQLHRFLLQKHGKRARPSSRYARLSFATLATELTPFTHKRINTNTAAGEMTKNGGLGVMGLKWAKLR